MFDVGRCVETLSMCPAVMHSFSFKPVHSPQINSHMQSRALIRWKLIAVNSLNQMLKGFEPLEEIATVMNEVCS